MGVAFKNSEVKEFVQQIYGKRIIDTSRSSCVLRIAETARGEIRENFLEDLIRSPKIKPRRSSGIKIFELKRRPDRTSHIRAETRCFDLYFYGP